MRTFDLAPLYRSTVGFDRLFSMLDGFESAPGYPPYNIERTGENDYRVTVAVAGFGENELSIEAKENTLTIKGSKQVKEEQNGEVLYQGIAARAFERVFQLAEIREARMEHGETMLAWLRMGDGIVMVGHANPEIHRIHSPDGLGQTTVQMMVYVPDIDAHYAHAGAAGADITMTVEDAFYGERRYEATDLEGHRWHFAERFTDIRARGGTAPEAPA